MRLPVRTNAKRPAARPGQAVVEFALIIVVLAGLVYGLLEISKLVFTNAELENAAREASHYASRHPFVSAATLRTNIIGPKLTIIDVNSVDFTVSEPTFPRGGVGPFYPVEVSVSYTWTSMVNFVPDMNNLRLNPLGPLTLSATSVSLIEGR